jgi:hypothetical protein
MYNWFPYKYYLLTAQKKQINYAFYDEETVEINISSASASDSVRSFTERLHSTVKSLTHVLFYLQIYE